MLNFKRITSALPWVGVGVGCYIAGGLTVLAMPPQYLPPSAKPYPVVKEVKTTQFDTWSKQAQTACMMSLDEVAKLRREFEACKPKPVKAVAK